MTDADGQVIDVRLTKSRKREDVDWHFSPRNGSRHIADILESV